MAIGSIWMFDPTTRARPWLQWLIWFGALAVLTVILVAFRSHLDKAHVSLGFLLVVLGGSSAGGRALGLSLATTAFLAFNYFFVPPYDTLVVANPLDWFVLGAFLITGAVAAQLLENERRQAALARERAAEIDRLATERVRLMAAEAEAEALRRSDRLKDVLLASVSHDLRTPLTAIKAIANEIWRGGDPTRAFTIEQESDRLTVLVNDLLELSQITIGALPVNRALNTADDVVGAALERVEAVHGADRITVHIASDGAILVGNFDFAHTMRALTNLLENAVKYSAAGAPIRLEATRAGGVLRFVVEDSGPGIAPEDVEHIFEAFYRGNRVVDGVRGTGLGLAIARQLAEAQDGTLRHEPRPGGGSRFVLELPGADAPAA